MAFKRNDHHGGTPAGAIKTDASGFPEAVRFFQASNFGETIRLCGALLKKNAGNSDAMHLLGVALLESGSSSDAEKWIRKAIQITPENPEFHFSLGNILQAMGRTEEALKSFETVLSIAPEHGAAIYNIGNLYLKEGAFEQSARFFEKAAELNPDSPGAWHNFGAALAGTGRTDAAIRSFERALKIDPGSAVSHNSIGVLKKERGDLEGAAGSFLKAIEASHVYAAAWMNLGNAYTALSLFDGALDCYRTALSINPDLEEVHYNLGNLFQEQGDTANAMAAYAAVLKAKPAYSEAAVQLYYQARLVCDWPLAEYWEGRLDADTKQSLSRGMCPAEMPFISVIRSMDPGINHDVASAWSRKAAAHFSDIQPFASNRSWADRKPPITVGYISRDFGNHPVGLLVAGMLQCHDRSRFRVHGYAYGPNDGSDARKRIEGGCDRFVDLGKMPTLASAQRICEDRVDILIDLTGHTRGNRIDIPALRPAPVQASYLGFLASSGADFIDYILTDRWVTPPDQADAYSEKFVYLPHSFMVTDNRQKVSEKRFSKKEFGLPEEAFVFCSFNNSYKIDPGLFDCWMRILKQVPGSVLWLYAKNNLTEENLKREAVLRDISPERLVFANKVPLEEHLARLGLADIALDTWCYNGGATTVNALWAAVPVITLSGRHFVSRMTASTLIAAGMKELVTDTPSAYEGLAVQLAMHPEMLKSFRVGLNKNRQTAPLFDTIRFTRDVETAYELMWDRYTAGAPPARIVVEGS